MSEKKKSLLISNIVYGPVYADIFLNQHLRSLLDPQNIPAFPERVEYLIFTDEETIKTIQAHQHYLILKDMLPSTKCVVFEWPKELEKDKFAARYNMLIWAFRFSVEEALSRGTYLSAIVADLVFGKEYLKNTFAKLDAGHDAVFCLPLRTAAEAIIPHLLRSPWAMHGRELLQLGIENMHPLWVACHWDSPQFTKLPFTLIWNTGKGLLVHSFSITPIAFEPTEAMKTVQQVIDIEVPSFFKNVYWAKDAEVIPVIGCEPLRCYYPPFTNEKSSTDKVKAFSKQGLHLSQFGTLTQELFYPSEEIAAVPVLTRDAAHNVVEELLR